MGNAVNIVARLMAAPWSKRDIIRAGLSRCLSVVCVIKGAEQALGGRT